MPRDSLDTAVGRTARRRMRRIWHAGLVRWGHHAQQHMVEEGIDDLDVYHVLRFGKILRREASAYDGYCDRYVLRGESVDGFGMRLVLELDDWMMIVTCYVE